MTVGEVLVSELGIDEAPARRRQGGDREPEIPADAEEAVEPGLLEIREPKPGVRGIDRVEAGASELGEGVRPVLVACVLRGRKIEHRGGDRPGVRSPARGLRGLVVRGHLVLRRPRCRLPAGDASSHRVSATIALIR